MRVNDSSAANTAASQTGRAEVERARQVEAGASGRTRESSSSDSPDRVALSQIGSKLRALAMDSPERIAQLDKLSADVASGRYQPDADAVSRSLVDEMLRPATS